MNGLLSGLCAHYYKLKLKMNKQDDRFKLLFDNMLKFDGNVTVDELDAIWESTRQVCIASDDTMITFEKIKETEQRILQMLKSMGVRPRWFITGQIPGELEYELFYDMNGNVHVIKTKDLEPEPENPNIVKIDLGAWEYNHEDDDYDDCDEETNPHVNYIGRDDND